MNRLHAMTKIQRAALDGGNKDPKDIFMGLRFEIPNGGDNEVMSRKEIEAFATQSIQLVADAKFPVERARMALDILEGELRADLLDTVAELDITNPRDCREVYELHRKIGSSIGEPTLREAIDAVAVGGIDADRVAALVTRLNAIYPLVDPDGDVDA